MLIIKNIKKIVGILPKNTKVLKGAEMQQMETLDNAYIIIDGAGKIKSMGAMKDFSQEEDLLKELPTSTIRNTITIHAQGKILFPCWCDSHSHIVYAGSREQEFVDRIKGLSYEEIAENGGGILNSAKRLNDTPIEALLEQSWNRLEEVKHLGTGAIEIKSGYGLSVEGELKMLRVIQKLKELSSVTIKATFLGAHAYPLQYKENHQAYIDLIIQKMLPQIADEGLADYIDAFCEFGFFSTSETEQILEAGERYGLKAKIHANQLHYSGGVQLGVKHGAVSVDHLECVGDDEIKVLKKGSTIGTLLPSAAYFLGIKYQPARKMIDAGLPIALATDYNPGSSPSGNMPFVLSLACTQLKMSPEEAINAATINGAYAMEVNKILGSITIGKQANVFLTKEIPSYAFLPYAFGSNVIDTVIIKGKIQ